MKPARKLTRPIEWKGRALAVALYLNRFFRTFGRLEKVAMLESWDNLLIL
jgi:hypothetical protein